MNEAISRCMRMDDWIFEVKMVRALKVDSYGQPYKAIAHFNVNGDFAVLDGAMHGEEKYFNEKDLKTFLAMCEALGIKDLKIDNAAQLFDRKAQEDNCYRQIA